MSETGNSPDNSSLNTQTIIALILSIISTISGIILHYKLKHFKVCCLESDCVNSPPPTPHIDFNEGKIDIKKEEDVLTTESAQHNSQASSDS